jgi:hypothetical protein
VLQALGSLVQPAPALMQSPGQDAASTQEKKPPQSTSHWHELLQSTALEHALAPVQSRSQAPGPHAILPMHELLPVHRKLQLPEAPQSMSPLQAPLSQVMSQE